MGKKQHQKDKLYLTYTEWKDVWGGHKDDTATLVARAKYKRLPHTHCALSLLEFETPVCDPEGNVFDLLHILPFLKKFGINPITGKKCEAKDLVKLNYAKNAEGEYHCPITYRLFTPNSHIVAIRTTGNVYAYEAVETLNLKTKHMKDLLDDTPFTRSDIITIQDPHNLDKFNLRDFHHIKMNLKADDEIERERRAQLDPAYTLRRPNQETRETLAKMKTDYKSPSVNDYMVKSRPNAPIPVSDDTDEINAAHYSTGEMSSSFTCTVMQPHTANPAAQLDEQTLIYRRVKKNGYVRLMTNVGPLNVELFCEQVPKTCDNFIRHCKSGYYTDTIFHRLIKNFMIQGGDPTGKGTGGDSAFGGPLKDEFVKSLHHEGRGILSMANSGKDTNKSQFFITFRSCKHLDNKHTIFGRVVGGLETLSAMEQTEVDEKDRPKEKITIIGAQVFVDPYVEAEQQLVKERETLVDDKQRKIREAEADRRKLLAEKAPDAIKPAAYGSGVGKYIRPAGKRPVNQADDTELPDEKKKKILKSSLNDFSAW